MQDRTGVMELGCKSEGDTIGRILAVFHCTGINDNERDRLKCVAIGWAKNGTL